MFGMFPGQLPNSRQNTLTRKTKEDEEEEDLSLAYAARGQRSRHLKVCVWSVHIFQSMQMSSLFCSFHSVMKFFIFFSLLRFRQIPYGRLHLQSEQYKQRRDLALIVFLKTRTHTMNLPWLDLNIKTKQNLYLHLAKFIQFYVAFMFYIKDYLKLEL